MCIELAVSAAQVVPLGALYARAKVVAARERREGAVEAVALDPSVHDGAEAQLPEPRAGSQVVLDGRAAPVRELSLAGRS